MLHPFFSAILVTLSMMAYASGLEVGYVDTWDWPPHNYCNIDDPTNQTYFNGTDYFTRTIQIINATGWNGTKYDVQLYCVNTFDTQIDQLVNYTLENEYGGKLLFAL